jgi:secreted trypsin-like serine protease
MNTGTRRVQLSIVCLTALTSFTSPASAIAIRHDLSVTQYEQAAEQFPAVCQVTVFGSGVLIAPQWVLTAAHVGIVQKMLPPEAQVAMIGDQIIPIESFHVMDSRTGVNPMDPEAPDDIALIKLAEPVKGIAPMPMLTQSIDTDTPCWLVGGGILSIGDVGKAMGPELMQDTSRAMRAGTNTLNPSADDPKLASISFSAPDDKSATELEAGSNVGDSGGAILVMHEGAWHVAGVISHMDSKSDDRIGIYEDHTFVTLAATYQDWFHEIMSAEQ